MNENQENVSDQQEQETVPGHTRPMNPFFSGRLGRLSGIGTSSPFRNAGSQGEIWVFITLFVILISTFIGAANQSLLIGIVSFVVIIALAVIVNVILIRPRSSARRTGDEE